MDLKTTLKNWILPIAMLTGASLYLLYHYLPEPVHKAGPVLEGVVQVLQPLLIFAMLFLTFCRIEPRELKPHRWHWWLLLIQGGIFTILGFLIVAVRRWMPDDNLTATILLESAMLCMICPTATAAAVVTRKLGGDVPGITTYIVLINLLAAVLIPLILPMVDPASSGGFMQTFNLIVAKVFPLLITPCLCAWLVRYLLPRLHRWLMGFQELAFYLWTVALTLAIAMTTKAIVNSEMSVGLILSMALVSLVCCVFNFASGRAIGSRYRSRKNRQLDMGEVNKVTAGQSIGQKNTVFVIWLAYTFMTPETSIVGGLYSIWHNVYNSWQLYHVRKS